VVGLALSICFIFRKDDRSVDNEKFGGSNSIN